jgi:gamma-D-glutamyl-L-lysine dipeptidyl-peptidase
MKYLLRNCLRIFFVSVVLLLEFFAISCKTSEINDIQSVVDIISDKWIPDKREGICTINYMKGEGNTLIVKGETDCPQIKNEILDTLRKLNISYLDSISVLPSVTLGEYRYGLVSLSVINLRKTPEHSSEMVSQSILGTPLKILKSDNDWLLVQTPDKYIAWTEKSSVQVMNEKVVINWRNSPRLIFMDNSGWIYESPDEKEVISDVVAGCIMKNDGVSAKHFKVILPDEREGFVRKHSVLDFEIWKNDMVITGQKVYKYASSLMGLPYLWGGTSTKGVDCSGFVQTVYFLNGIILSRDASLQALHGSMVDIKGGWNNLETGDLLFFGSVRNSKQRVTHVAIYKGDSEFIHSSGRVMINSLDSTRVNFSRYRKNSLLSARRIIGSVGSSGIVAVKDHDWY